MKGPMICPMVGHDGNRALLTDWIENHESYQLVDTESAHRETDVDLCIVDRQGFEAHRETLIAAEEAQKPALLPVLLLLPENGTKAIENGQLEGTGDATEIFDDVITMPIRKTELQWRLKSLLRLRSQSLEIHTDLLRFKKGVEASGVGVYITDPDGTIEYVNSAWEEITGYDASEAIGRNPRFLNSGTQSEEYYENLWDTILEGDTWAEEITNRRKDGELFTVKQTISPVTSADGLEAFVGVMTDISDRIRREEKLRRRTRAIDNAPVGILITGTKEDDNPLIYMNDAVETITGYSREDLLGENLRILQGENTDPDRVARFREAIEAEEPATIELRNYRKDGSEFWNRMGIAPIKDESGVVDGWVGFQEDVTERKQRTRQLAIMNRWLRHTLRNDMNIVRGRAEIIRSKGSEKVDGSAQTIMDVSDHLIEMTEKAKQIVTILQSDPTTREIDLSTELERIVSEVKAEYPSAVVTIDCPEGVTADPSEKFDTAIIELLSNAIVHSDRETPRVDITVEEHEGSVDIMVADNGPTIGENERMIQLDEEENPLSHGSGLGIWLVNLIAIRSGGSMSFEENSPRGNVVHIKLP